MMQKKPRPSFMQKRFFVAFSFPVLFVFIMSFFVPKVLHAEESIGTVIAVKEKVYVFRSGKDERLPVQRGDDILLADTYETEAGARAKLLFQDDSLITLGESTRLLVSENIYKPAEKQRSSIMHLLSGSARALVGKTFSNAKSKFEIHTPTSVAAAKGTYFIVKICEEKGEELCSEVFNLSRSSLVLVQSKDPGGAPQLRGGLSSEVKLSKSGGDTVALARDDKAATGDSVKNQRLELLPHEMSMIKTGKEITVLREGSPEYANKLSAAIRSTEMKEAPDKARLDARLRGLTLKQIAKLEFASNLPGDDCGRGILPHLTSLLATSTASLLGQCESSKFLIIQQLPPAPDPVGSPATSDVTLGFDFQ